MAQGSQRGNWAMRLGAILGSAGVFVGFWQLSIHYPYPDQNSAAANATPTPADTFTIPTSGGNPVPLPAPPHGSTGLSR